MVSFQAGIPLAAGIQPDSIAATDLNGDGIPDLIIADAGTTQDLAGQASTDGGVDVLFGAGSGNFAPAVSFPSGGNGQSLAVGNLNGDGVPDAVVGDFLIGTPGNAINVLLGSNAGGFVTDTSYLPADPIAAVAIADVNGDGLPDVLFADLFSGVDVLLGNGEGGFSGATQVYADMGFPFAISTADLNGDGVTDLIVTNIGAGDVAVLLGNGQGGFGPATLNAVGGDPSSVAVADLNGDGIPDLVVADGSGGVDVLFGTGGGMFAPATPYAAGTATAVVVADINGDGHPDIVVADQGSSADNLPGGVDVLLGNGTGSFAPAIQFATGTDPTHLAVADFNGDGKPDIAIINGAAAEILFNTTPAACYCHGTSILTRSGEKLVEDLAIGDELVTVGNAVHPIKWMGRRSYSGAFVAGNHLMLPVCVRASALADGVPHRDLYVSPGHALFVGGQLVPAWRLVNGVSITQAAAVDSVTYYHVELDRHAVILANGARAESFLDDGCRGQFQNAAEFDRLYPGAAAMAPLQPRLEDGFGLQALQARLAARAGLLAPVEPAGALRGFIDMATPHRLTGWAQDTDSPEEPVALEISMGGAPVLCVLANAYRADLRQAGFGSGCHAFDVNLPDAVAGRAVVRRVTDGWPLTATRAAGASAGRRRSAAA